MFGWLQRRRRERIRKQPVPDAWWDRLEPWLDNLWLNEEEETRLLEITKILVAEKNWEGCGGLELTEAMCAAVAAQMALLVLEIPHDYFAESYSVLVYPTTYMTQQGDVRDGEAWYRGPVVLAWERVEQDMKGSEYGMNVVLHEYAHRLDMHSGFSDGAPPLEGRVEPERWKRVMLDAFERHCDAVDDDEDTPIDPYGAKNEAEFFAVATEHFFGTPEGLEEVEPEVYAVLRDYYRQDPAARYRAIDAEIAGAEGRQASPTKDARLNET